MICPGVFFIYDIFIFQSVTWVKGQKNCPRWEISKNVMPSCLKISYVLVLVCEFS